MNLTRSILFLLSSGLVVSCADDPGAGTGTALTKAEAMTMGGVGPSGEDLCADNDWYGDGVCDDWCVAPDPDCPDAGTPRDGGEPDAGALRDGGRTDGGRMDGGRMDDGGMPDGGSELPLEPVDCSPLGAAGTDCTRHAECRPGLRCELGSCQAVSTECSVDSDCGANARCEGTPATVCLEPAGRACADTSRCPFGEACNPSTGTCEAGPAEGERAAGIGCGNGYLPDGSGLCQLAPVGTCSDSSQDCRADHTCAPLCTYCPGEWICAPLKATASSQGDFCDFTDCSDDFYCADGDPDGRPVCYPRYALGDEWCATAATYRPWVETCLPGLVCDYSAPNYDGVCRRLVDGDPCAGDDRCPEGLYCDSGGTCRTKPSRGEACDATTTCADGLSCQAGIPMGRCATAACL